MWRAKLLNYSVSALLFAVCSLFIYAPNTYATSDYDNMLKKADDLIISKNCSNSSPVTCSETEDFTNSWLTKIQEISDLNSSSSNSSIATSFLNTYNDANAAGWAVGKVQNGDVVGFFACAWTNSVTFDFAANSTFNEAWFNPSASPSIKCVSVYYNGYYKKFVAAATNQGYNPLRNYPSSYMYIKADPTRLDDISYLFFNGEINYPTGYEGIMLPPSYTPPNSSDASPKFQVQVGQNYHITVFDINYVTTDGTYPVLCEDDLTPYIVDFNILDDGNNVIYHDDQITAGVYEITLPNTTPAGEYKVSGKYACAEPTDYIFQNYGVGTFKLDQNGNVDMGTLKSCVVDGVPSVDDLDNCVNDLKNFAFIFSNYNLPKDMLEQQFTCGQLQVMGDWIDYHGTVCPAIPSGVRQVVTPFVIFALALAAITYFALRDNSGRV